MFLPYNVRFPFVGSLKRPVYPTEVAVNCWYICNALARSRRPQPQRSAYTATTGTRTNDRTNIFK